MFLRYISQVLPSLGETDVVLSTVGELYPGVRAIAADGPAAAVVKGDLRMAAVVKAAVRDRQRVPRGDLEIVTEDMTLRLGQATSAPAPGTARGRCADHTTCRASCSSRKCSPHSCARKRAQLDRPVDADDLPYLRCGAVGAGCSPPGA